MSQCTWRECIDYMQYFRSSCHLLSLLANSVTYSDRLRKQQHKKYSEAELHSSALAIECHVLSQSQRMLSITTFKPRHATFKWAYSAK